MQVKIPRRLIQPQIANTYSVGVGLTSECGFLTASQDADYVGQGPRFKKCSSHLWLLARGIVFLVSSIIAYASLCAQNKYHFVFRMLNSELSFKTETRETFVCLFIFYFLVLQSEIETFLLHFHGILWVSLLIHMTQCTDITFLVAFPSDCEFIKDKDHEELILEFPKATML